LFAAMLVAAATSAQASVQISSNPTHDMNCADGVCAPTARKANLNATDLANMLTTSDVKVVTGSGAVTIGILSPLTWASTNRLTLDANESVHIDAPVVVEGTAGLTIVTNDGGTGGDLIFSGKGNVTFWDLASSLAINGDNYTLVGDIASLASAIASNPSGRYALANDYDASVDGQYERSPVATELTGTFEGLGHMISNLSIESGGAAALFFKASGTMRDVGLQNVDIVANNDAASLLAEDDAATIIGCYATGSVSGLVAYYFATAGGLVATTSTAGGTIIRSHAKVSVRLEDATWGGAGGLVGVSSGLNITLSYASGHVSGYKTGYAGGLVGVMNGGSISQSFATGRVRASKGGVAGGLVGHGENSSIQDSYATGAVHGGAYIGGFAAGFYNLIVHASYSIGVVEGGGKHANPGGFVGGAGDGSDLKWDYWGIDTSKMTQGYAYCDPGVNCAEAIQGLHTSQFQSGLPEGFNRKIWGQMPNINSGYPYLLANPPPQ